MPFNLAELSQKLEFYRRPRSRTMVEARIEDQLLQFAEAVARTPALPNETSEWRSSILDSIETASDQLTSAKYLEYMDALQAFTGNAGYLTERTIPRWTAHQWQIDQVEERDYSIAVYAMEGIIPLGNTRDAGVMATLRTAMWQQITARLTAQGGGRADWRTNLRGLAWGMPLAQVGVDPQLLQLRIDAVRTLVISAFPTSTKNQQLESRRRAWREVKQINDPLTLHGLALGIPLERVHDDQLLALRIAALELLTGHVPRHALYENRVAAGRLAWTSISGVWETQRLVGISLGIPVEHTSVDRQLLRQRIRAMNYWSDLPRDVDDVTGYYFARANWERIQAHDAMTLEAITYGMTDGDLVRVELLPYRLSALRIMRARVLGITDVQPRMWEDQSLHRGWLDIRASSVEQLQGLAWGIPLQFISDSALLDVRTRFMRFRCGPTSAFAMDEFTYEDYLRYHAAWLEINRISDPQTIEDLLLAEDGRRLYGLIRSQRLEPRFSR